MIRETIIFLIAIILAVGSVYLIVTMDSEKSSGRYINCGVSEISPDFSNEMKEACRKARSNSSN